MISKRKMIDVSIAIDGTEFYGADAYKKCKAYEEPLIKAIYDEISEHVIIVPDHHYKAEDHIVYHMYIRDDMGIDSIANWFRMKNLRVQGLDRIDQSWIGKWFTVADPDGTNFEYVIPHDTLDNTISKLLDVQSDLHNLLTTIHDIDHESAQQHINEFANRKK